jgi:lymphocyte antigen 75
MKSFHHHNSGSPVSDLSKRADCNAKLPFICERYNVSSLEKYSPDPAAKVQCTEKWIPFQNKVRRESFTVPTMVALVLLG